MSRPTLDDPVVSLLTSALREARTDARWAVPARPGMAHRVRRASQRRRRRTAVGGVVGAAVVLSGAVAGFASLPDPDRPGERVFAVGAPGAPGAPATKLGAPVPGISPEFVPTSGRDWLLDDLELEQFAATHTTPSPRPNPVQSPAPLTDYSARLLADVEGALPEGATTQRQDALNGDPSTAGIHVRLADGTPVEVTREPLQQPISYQSYFSDGTGRAAPDVTDIPDSASALVAADRVGYGWGPDIPADARAVTVIRADGEMTRWFAPLTVPLETVKAWALAPPSLG